MAPKTRARSAKAGADDSQNTERCGDCGASKRSQDIETAKQGTANAAANVSAAPLDSIEPVEPRESADVPSPAVLSEWNGRRRRTACSKSFYFRYTYKRRNGLPTRDELEVADFLVTEDFRSRWASGSASDDELVAIVQLKKDPNHSNLLPCGTSLVQGATRLDGAASHRGIQYMRDSNSSLQHNGFIRPTAEYLQIL